MTSLIDKKCQACEGGVPALSPDESKEFLKQVPHWQLLQGGKTISRKFTFKGFLSAMSFVNAVAYIAQQEGHHPDMEVGFNYCTINFTTHAIGGLSENDFICAAKINALGN